MGRVYFFYNFFVDFFIIYFVDFFIFFFGENSEIDFRYTENHTTSGVGSEGSEKNAKTR